MQLLAVYVVVGIAVLMAARKAWQSLRRFRKPKLCGSSSPCAGCPLKENCGKIP